MTLQELQAELSQLPIEDRWRLVQTLLASIQSETVSPHSETEAPNLDVLKSAISTELHPWTKRLIGTLPPDTDTSKSSYIDYLEEKYR